MILFDILLTFVTREKMFIRFLWIFCMEFLNKDFLEVCLELGMVDRVVYFTLLQGICNKKFKFIHIY